MRLRDSVLGNQSPYLVISVCLGWAFGDLLRFFIHPPSVEDVSLVVPRKLDWDNRR
jgi:hypothetical protein